MEVIKYTAERLNEWNSFIDSAKNPLFMFYRQYMEYHKDRFTDNSLMFYENDKLWALLPANIVHNILYSHGGLTFGGVITNKDMKQHHMIDVFSSLKNYMRANDISQIIYKEIPHIYHLIPAEEDGYALFLNGAKISKIEPATVVLNKNRPKVSKGRKAQAVRAKREGVVVRETQEFDDFIALENEVLAEYHNAKAVHTGQELTLLHDRFPEHIKLIGGFLDDKMIAGSVVFIYDKIVKTQYLASNDLGRRIGALDYVIMTMLDEFNDKTWFDFGISTEEAGKLLNNGLISQKEGFGGRTVNYRTWIMGG